MSNEFFDVDLQQIDTSELDVSLADASGVTQVEFTLTVAGANSPVYVAAIEEARTAAKKRAKRAGVDTLSYHDQQEIVRLRAARCIVGWSGIKKQYSKAAAEQLLATYPSIVSKVIAHTDDEANFLQVSGKDS